MTVKNLKILSKATQLNVLFHDVLAFLRLAQSRPLDLTKTGNLQRKEIEAVAEVFHDDLFQREKYGDMLYPPKIAISAQ